ncbi:MAG: hypothetical protein CMF12_08840 [Idiomarina sp.]|uniref:hypothetical protein n=1 Tax=Idiomarina sp. TaxID=1874361 RepID=UPI000C4AF277|nr:hypothetical protein [Idiomarina sp.]MBT42617.1 hypothetical protein [Idiomarina sp.]|tara:strand:+ start:191 stop:553 length:363 start_codon:yes stop_codon:yes gene_type:complete
MTQLVAANFEGMQTTEQSSKKMATWSTVALLAVISVLFSTLALAGSGGSTEFGTIYDTFAGWISGVPGKIIAILAFGAAMFNVVKQNFMMAAGAFIGAVVMANAGAAIDLLFSAGVPVTL